MIIAQEDSYRTDPSRHRNFFLRPKFMFYPQAFRIVWKSGREALAGAYSADAWARSSHEILHALENVGVIIEITGMDNIRKPEGPVVFIGNHMSTLETFVLPCIIQPVRPVTFVVKKSLIEMPVFGPVMRSRDPVVVGRINPREDLKTVLEKGTEKLREGTSLIIFPQSTRSERFKPEEFNTLGVKLALRAGVPVVPIALKTDAWGIGRVMKDFGPLDIRKKVYFAFGEPMTIQGRGAEEHENIIRFIIDNLTAWERRDHADQE